MKKSLKLFCRLDMSFFDNPKMQSLDPIAREVALKMITYCARELTDGFIPKNAALELANMEPFKELLGQFLGRRPLAKLDRNLLASGAVVDRLWRANVLEVVPDGYRVHDYLDWQQSSEDVQKRRESDAIRQRNLRARIAKKTTSSRRDTPRDSQCTDTEQQQRDRGGKNNKQQATTQTPEPTRDPEEFAVVVESVLAGLPPTTTIAHTAVEAPSVGRSESQTSKSQLERKPPVKALPRDGGWEPGNEVGCRDDFRAWVRSKGWRHALKTEKNATTFNSLISVRPISAVELAAIVPVVELVDNPNGGLALTKLAQARESKPRQAHESRPNSPTEKDEQRRRENEEDAKKVNRITQAKRARETLEMVMATIGT